MPWCGAVWIRCGENAAAKIASAAGAVDGRLYVYADRLWPPHSLASLQSRLSRLYHAAHRARPSVDVRVPLLRAIEADQRLPPEVSVCLGFAKEEGESKKRGLPFHVLSAAEEAGQWGEDETAGEGVTQFKAA
eukprot:Hpha_TRINITY_DN19276_c0_g1::TRINITY_DN19276_c0_g1_i1::g.194275::m.194275